MLTIKRTFRSQPYRSGSAVIEMAVFLPLLTTLVFGSIELCSGVYLRQTLTIAAYEGLRAACYSGSKTGEATPVAQTILTNRRVRGSSISFTPASPEATPPGTVITIRVSAPANLNCFRFAFLPNRSFVVTSTMVKE